jgi:hypothetical protein
VYSDDKENPWDAADVETARQRVLDDLITMRDEFVYRHQTALLAALERDVTPIPVAEPVVLAATAWTFARLPQT